MPDVARTYHVARPDQVGAYSDIPTLDAAVMTAYAIAVAEGIPVSVLRADGDLAEGVPVSWTQLAVISPPPAEEATR